MSTTRAGRPASRSTTSLPASADDTEGAATGARSRIEGTRQDEVLDAALEVLEQVGCDRLTMDAVAVAARAGKASLYRRWGSKTELVGDAIARAHRRCGVLTQPDTGTLRGDLVEAVYGAGFDDPRLMRVMAGVFTAMQHDEELRQHLLERFVAPQHAAVLVVFERARARGEVHPDADLDMLAQVLPAMLSLRQLISGLPPDPLVALRVIDQVLLPAATAPAPSHPAAHQPPA